MLKWRTGLPEESGYYLVLYVNNVGYAHVTELEFSAVHKLWNCHDSAEPDWAKDHCIEGVRFWIPLDEVIPSEFEFSTK